MSSKISYARLSDCEYIMRHQPHQSGGAMQFALVDKGGRHPECALLTLVLCLLSFCFQLPRNEQHSSSMSFFHDAYALESSNHGLLILKPWFKINCFFSKLHLPQTLKVVKYMYILLNNVNLHILFTIECQCFHPSYLFIGLWVTRKNSEYYP